MRESSRFVLNTGPVVEVREPNGLLTERQANGRV
jgi:hypothetical protein